MADIEETIVCDGLIRRYFLHLPADYSSLHSAPLLIALHGRFGSGKKLSRETGFNDLADRENFAVVYPDGFMRSWADGRGFTRADKRGVDDVAFVVKLIEVLQTRFKLNEKRTYVVGYSNGGFMALRLAVDLPDRFCAVAVVAASLTDSLANRIRQVSPSSVLFIHGTADTATPYKGGVLTGHCTTLPVEDAAKAWAASIGCSGPPKVETINHRGLETRVSAITYVSCRNGGQARILKIEGGHHEWPRGRGGLDASKEMWEFFKILPCSS